MRNYSICIIRLPAHIAEIPTHKENVKYMATLINSCPLIRDRDSAANVLKVVNPPQKPTSKRHFNSAEILFFAAIPNSTPIIKQPITFTTNVPHGNGLSAQFDTILDNIYLNTLPTAPPKATHIIFFINHLIAQPYYKGIKFI